MLVLCVDVFRILVWGVDWEVELNSPLFHHNNRLVEFVSSNTGVVAWEVSLFHTRDIPK